MYHVLHVFACVRLVHAQPPKRFLRSRLIGVSILILPQPGRRTDHGHHIMGKGKEPSSKRACEIPEMTVGVLEGKCGVNGIEW